MSEYIVRHNEDYYQIKAKDDYELARKLYTAFSFKDLKLILSNLIYSPDNKDEHFEELYLSYFPKYDRDDAFQKNRYVMYEDIMGFSSWENWIRDPTPEDFRKFDMYILLWDADLEDSDFDFDREKFLDQLLNEKKVTTEKFIEIVKNECDIKETSKIRQIP